MNLKLSIITINFNNASGLLKTMESVFNQTSLEFEYIVVDGNSSDGSKELITKFVSDNDVGKYGLSGRFTWISESDLGIYNAMNKGISMAKGEYCQFLNSGDHLVTSNVTERMLINMTDCSFIYGNKLKVLSNASILYNKKMAEISMLTFYIGSINHCTVYIKRSLFGLYGMYDESLKIVSDWKFFLVTIGLHNEKIEYKDVDLCYFDMSGISNTNSVLEKSERRLVLEELLPPTILSDYDAYWFDIEQMKRIKRYKLVSKLVWFIERCLFKLEKRKTKRRKGYLLV